MGEINQSCKRAINVTINNLRKEAGKENPDKAVVYDLYLDLQVCCQFGFINDPFIIIPLQTWLKIITAT